MLRLRLREETCVSKIVRCAFFELTDDGLIESWVVAGEHAPEASS